MLFYLGNPTSQCKDSSWVPHSLGYYRLLENELQVFENWNIGSIFHLLYCIVFMYCPRLKRLGGDKTTLHDLTIDNLSSLTVTQRPPTWRGLHRRCRISGRQDQDSLNIAIWSTGEYCRWSHSWQKLFNIENTQMQTDSDAPEAIRANLHKSDLMNYFHQHIFVIPILREAAIWEKAQK